VQEWPWGLVNGGCRVVSSAWWVAAGFFGVGGWVGCYIVGVTVAKFSDHCHPEKETINFLVFVDMTVRSLDCRHEDGSYIHEFIWYQKEKKSGRSCLSLPSYGWILHALFTNATKNCTCNWKCWSQLCIIQDIGWNSQAMHSSSAFKQANRVQVCTITLFVHI
jgi:hypothetical protein